MNPTDWTDPRLTERLDELIEHARISRINRNVRAREDADDLRSEVLARLLATGTERLQGQPVAAWRAYLKEAVENAVIDLHRRHLSAQKRNARRDTREADAVGPVAGSAPNLLGGLPSGHTSPTQRARNREVGEMLRAAIEKLPERYRQVIQMQLDGKKIAEIADALGLTVPAVESRLRRAKIKLGQFLNLSRPEGK